VTQPDLERFADIPDPLATFAPRASTEVPSALGERLRASTSPTRAEVRSRRLAGAALAVGWAAAMAGVLGVRPDAAQLPGTYLVLWCVAPALLAFAGMIVLSRSGRSGLGVRLGLVAALAVALPGALAVVALGLPTPPAAVAGPSFVRGLVVCLDMTLVGALPPLVLAVVVLRRAFPSAARWRGALVGAVAGLLSATAMNVHCPLVDPMHMLVGHAVPIVLAAGLGALLAHRFLRA
jgi:hypothetical protein